MTTTPPPMPEPALHLGITLSNRGKYKSTEDGYTAKQIQDRDAQWVEAWDYMTPERIARGWTAVCVANKDNLPAAPQHKGGV